MAIYKCKMCGGELDVQEGVTVVECDFCGTNQTVPTSKDENLQGLFNRANILRIKSEFDKAENLYEKILQVDETQAEAYWGLILCKYGVEYVEDSKTFSRIPTCHRTSVDSIIADDDYKSAIQYADSVQRGIYEAEAKKIDCLQKEILDLYQKEEPYDVFICYKETDENGRRTQDSVIANDIYYQLTNEGYKVFYAAITLEDKIGCSYEPYIFAALNSAKVMLAVGTKPEFFNAVWVKNEWSRFLKMMKKDREKMLIPCYKGMDAYELPEEFAHLQAQDMGKIGFVNDIVRGMSKVIGKEKKEVSTSTVVENTNSSVGPLLERVFIFLEDKDWDSANEYCEKILDQEPKNGYAYLCKLMVDLNVSKKEDLKNCRNSFEENANYIKAVRFADDMLKEELDGVNQHIKVVQYNKAVALFDKGFFYAAINVLEQIKDHEDSKKLLEKAKGKVEDTIQLATASINQKFVIINEKGEIVKKTNFDYDDTYNENEFNENGFALVCVNDKWGYIDESGEMVIKPQFDFLGNFAENGLAVVEVDGKYGYIDESGEIVIKPQYDDAGRFTKNGFASVCVNDKWGYIDESGEMVIKPQYDDVWGFRENGLSAVKVKGKWGYIDESGNMVIKPWFDWVCESCKNGLVPVCVNDKWGFIDESGNMVIKPQFDGIDEDCDYNKGRFAVYVNDKRGFIDESGNMVIKPQFDSGDSFDDNGLARVEVKGKYGYIDESGNMVIKPQYDDTSNFGKNGLVAVDVKGKWGYIDESGNMVIKPQFDSGDSFDDNGLARVKVKGKYGYIDESGNMVINPQYDWVGDFAKNGLARVKVDGKYGYIDESGNMVIKPQFDDVSNFSVLSTKAIDEHKKVRKEIEKEKKKCERLFEEYKEAIIKEKSENGKKIEANIKISSLSKEHNLLCNLKNEWQRIELELALTTERIKSVQAEITVLNNEKNNLGIFAGKRKKEIAEKINVLEKEYQSILQIKETQEKKKNGYKNIYDIESAIEKTVKQIEEQKKVIEELQFTRTSQTIRDELSSSKIGKRYLHRLDSL